MDLNKRLNTYNNSFRAEFEEDGINLNLIFHNKLRIKINQNIVDTIYEDMYNSMRGTLITELKTECRYYE